MYSLQSNLLKNVFHFLQCHSQLTISIIKNTFSVINPRNPLIIYVITSLDKLQIYIALKIERPHFVSRWRAHSFALTS